MAELKFVATEQLRILVALLVIGNGFRMVPSIPDSACGRDVYARLVLTHDLLCLDVLAAALLLFSVRLTARTADSAAAGWKRRALLLLGVCLSAAAFPLAASTCEDGFLYRTGCAAPAGTTGWRLAWLVMFVALVLPVQRYTAWVAVRGKARPWSWSAC